MKTHSCVSSDVPGESIVRVRRPLEFRNRKYTPICIGLSYRSRWLVVDECNGRSVVCKDTQLFSLRSLSKLSVAPVENQFCKRAQSSSRFTLEAINFVHKATEWFGP